MKLVKAFLPASKSFSHQTPKTQIVLHHTVGSSRPDYVGQGFAATEGHIAVPYVIGGISTKNDTAFDGVVYKLAEPEADFYHLGVKNSGKPAGYYDFRSVGIEICNYGQLVKKPDGFYGLEGRVKVPEAQVCDLGFVWRGSQYWQHYSDNQIEALEKLLGQLFNRFKWSVKKKNWGVSDFATDLKTAGQDQVVTHTNYRADKFDVYPHPGLIAMLNRFCSGVCLDG